MAELVLPKLAGDSPLVAARHGLKAAWLDRAQRGGEHVPPAFAIDTELALGIAAGEPSALAALDVALHALRSEPGRSSTLAVRASPTRSVPGALLTRLGVADELGSVAQAVRAVVSSGERPQVREHWSARREAPPTGAWIGILVQRQLSFDGAEDFGAVVFSHDPSSGDAGARGEYAPGGVVDVVSGRTQPLPLERSRDARSQRSLAVQRPEAFQQVVALSERLARSLDEPLELELAFVEGAVWLLQMRPLTLSPRALVRVALAAIETDSAGYGRWLLELAQRGLDSMVEQRFADAEASEPLLRGLAASPGAAQGVLVTDIERALRRAQHEPVVLLRPDAVPEDIAAFRVAQAVVTSSGGLTCHAAVIARGLALPAVVGVEGIRVDVRAGVVWGGRDRLEVLAREGDWVSVDGRRGSVHRGPLTLEPRIHDAELQRLFVEVRKLRPAPLWVYGAPSHALRLKDDACLDGALCNLPEQGELPAGRGRECWVEIDAAQIAQRLPGLPRGWGVVVTGALHTVSVAALRRDFPLRAVGFRVATPDATPPDAPIDLLVTDFDPDHDLQNRLRAARLLRSVTFPERLSVPTENNVGWLCPAASAALTALRYAAKRRERPGSVV